MYLTGDLLHFKRFIFADGGKPKNKFAIVFKHDVEYLLISLTTTQDKYLDSCYIPEETGPINRGYDRWFYFAPDHCICNDTGYCFPNHTFVPFRNNVREFDQKNFLGMFTNGDVELKGSLNNDILLEFLYAALKSDWFPEKHITFLESIIENLTR